MDGFPCNLILATFLRICQDSPNLVEIGYKCCPLYTKAYILLPFPAALNLNQIALKWYKAVGIAEEV
jgi:hypothetical protein